MRSVYLSNQLKAQLVRAARQRGFAVERGRSGSWPNALPTGCALTSKLVNPRVRAEWWIGRSGCWRGLARVRPRMRKSATGWPSAG